MRLSRALVVAASLLLLAQAAFAEVVRIEITRRDDFGTHERIIGRVHFAVDPALPANRRIADLQFAPLNADGRVEFSSDVLFFRPKFPARARGTVFFEIVNRGRDQALGIMSGAEQADLAPENWSLGDRFLLEQGFTVAFLGWQFDVRPVNGLTFRAPVAPVEGLVRGDYVERQGGREFNAFRVGYCAMESRAPEAKLFFRSAMGAAPTEIPRTDWDFAANGCTVRVNGGLELGIYEAVYTAQGSPIAGLGLAAIRDFTSYLKYGPSTPLGAGGDPLRETPAALQKVVGYGYSQSARLLREFVRDGFNADERGRIAFDGLMIAAAGAGGGSFNHRFATPGVAGNSVLSVLRPVDLPPFTDDGLLAAADAAKVTPKIFYTVTSTEYWARAASLTHTSDDGMRDVPPGPLSRLYYIPGTPHASGPLQLTRFGGEYRYFLNFADQRWVSRALLMNLDAWVREDVAPPPSVYPTIADGQLVAREQVRFPTVPLLPFPDYMPQVWRMDFGPRFQADRIITQEPPLLGAPYRILVPQVDADGNETSGIRIPEVAVPLGTHTGWNIALPYRPPLGYLAGLVGSFQPFPRNPNQGISLEDPRRSIEERYRNRDAYLTRVRQAAEALVKQRFALAGDVNAMVERAGRTWDVVVGGAVQ